MGIKAQVQLIKCSIQGGFPEQILRKAAPPIALLKCSMRTSVFFTSEEYTSEPTIGQKGTFLPSSCAMPSANAVFPVPGAPATCAQVQSNFALANHSCHCATWCRSHVACTAVLLRFFPNRCSVLVLTWLDSQNTDGLA